MGEQEMIRDIKYALCFIGGAAYMGSFLILPDRGHPFIFIPILFISINTIVIILLATWWLVENWNKE